MPAQTVPFTGDELLVAVTEAMVALHERYHHRTPISAKTLLLDDELLACLLGGVYTDVEKTMIELQHTATVKQTRSTFQTATRHRFIGAIERLSGREGWRRRRLSLPMRRGQRLTPAVARALSMQVSTTRSGETEKSAGIPGASCLSPTR